MHFFIEPSIVKYTNFEHPKTSIFTIVIKGPTYVILLLYSIHEGSFNTRKQ